MKQGYTKPKFNDNRRSWKAHNNGRHWNNDKINNWEIHWSEDGESVVDHVYKESDARLIASAPLMFEVLRKLDAEGGHGLDNHKLIREALEEAIDILPEDVSAGKYFVKSESTRNRHWIRNYLNSFRK